METNETTWLGRHWRALLYIINICRFSLFILIAETVLLTVGQGQDLLLSIGGENINAYLLLLGSCLLWSFSLWLWSRTLLEINFPDTRADNDLLISYRRWVPRSLAALAFVSVSFALWNAGSPADKYIWPTIITGVIFTSLLSTRRFLGRWAAEKISQQPKQHWLYAPELENNNPQYTNWRDAYATRMGKVAAVLLGLWVVLFGWGIVSPVSMGSLLNAQMLLMLWGTTFLTVGSILTYWGNKSGFPVMSALLALVVISSFWNDNHAIRPMPGDSQPSDRPDVKQALAAWRDANCDNNDCRPFVIVATAGGGIRAAYWTGTILSHLQDEQAVFKDRLFAISAVSGGAMGSTVFRSMLIAKEQGGCNGKLLECTQAVLSKDFLSPLSASLLYQDLTQWFLPMPVPMFQGRGVTLEEAFVRSFHDYTKMDLLSTSFSQLSKLDRPWPALFLNAVWINNGRRSVASSVRIKDEPAFALANDQLLDLGYDIRLISAAHNSARAPYVSPAGSWHEGRGDDRTAGPIKGRLHDGGLFDTFGAETAMEIFNFARAELGEKFKPVVIQISSAPSMQSNLAESLPGTPVNILHEFIGMFRTVFATLDGRALELASILKQEAERHGSYAYFRMCQQEGEADPPFGWSLSTQARATIDGYLFKTAPGTSEPLEQATCSDENRDSLAKVLNKLK